MYYPVQSKEFGNVYPIRPDGSDGRWRVAKTTMEDLTEKGLVLFERQSDGRVEAYRVFPSGTKTQTAYPSMLDPAIVKTTAHGSIELREILGAGQFAYPKPSPLVRELISLCSRENDIVLDSFAGSGTTAHAVLALNKEDDGNRKFILVECEDYADTITAERVRRVINGVPSPRDVALREGMGSSFTYCTLGEPIDTEGLLTGENLPEYSALAAYVLHTCSGISAGANDLEPRDDDGLFYRNGEQDYYLLYRPDLDWLRSHDAMFNADMAQRIAQRNQAENRKAVVFAPGKYIGQRELTSMGLRFFQLPYQIHQRL